MKQRYIVYVLMCSSWAVILGSSSNAESSGNAASSDNQNQVEELQTIFTNPLKPDDYLFKLLGVELTDLAPLQTKDEIENKLNDPFQSRIDLMQKIPADLQVGISEAIHHAKSVLTNPGAKNLYSTVGHTIFSNLEFGNPQALQLILSYPVNIAPKRIIQYYSAVLNPNIPNPIAHMQNNQPIIHLPAAYNVLNTNQQKIYNALGHTAYIELSQKDLKDLEQSIRRHSDITPADIYKQRINQLWCEIAAGKPCEAKKEEKPDTKTSDGKNAPTKDEPGKPSEKTPSQPKDLRIEAFKKANPKLQSALHSLKTAKRHSKGIERDERADIKKRITNELNDYKAIKNIADDIKRRGEAAHDKQRDFAKLVDQIYSVSRSF